MQTVEPDGEWDFAHAHGLNVVERDLKTGNGGAGHIPPIFGAPAVHAGWLRSKGRETRRRIYRGCEPGMVTLRQLDIAHRERREGVIEHLRFSHVARQEGRVAAARMCSRQSPAAEIRLILKRFYCNDLAD